MALPFSIDRPAGADIIDPEDVVLDSEEDPPIFNAKPALPPPLQFLHVGLKRQRCRCKLIDLRADELSFVRPQQRPEGRSGEADLHTDAVAPLKLLRN